jgi:hypothetical protein
MKLMVKEPRPLASGFQALWSLSGAHAVSAAINLNVLYLGISSVAGRFGSPWAFSGNVDWEVDYEHAKRSFAAMAPTNSRRYVDRATAMMEVLKKPLLPDLHLGLDLGISSRRGAILLEKGTNWSYKAPRWCLMVVDGLGLEKGEEIAELLLAQREFHRIPKHGWYYYTGWPVKVAIDRSGDNEFLEAWWKDLRQVEGLD